MGAAEYIGEDVIEAVADRLRADYGQSCGVVKTHPAAVDEIIECHLNLTLAYADLRGQCGPNVRGAICLGGRTVWIDESLEPDTHPSQLAVWRFTAAHEIGHWMLHQKLLPSHPGPLLATVPSATAVEWGGTHSRRFNRIEHQAHLFAGALLMPRDILLRHWREATGSDQPVDACEEFAALGGDGEAGKFEPVVALAEQLAEPFQVSGFAMQIRLKRMKLLLLTRPALKPSAMAGAASTPG